MSINLYAAEKVAQERYFVKFKPLPPAHTMLYDTHKFVTDIQFVNVGIRVLGETRIRYWMSFNFVAILIYSENIAVYARDSGMKEIVLLSQMRKKKKLM